MASKLVEKVCTPCRGGTPPLTREQAETYCSEVPDWRMVAEETTMRRTFEFRNFAQALEFVQRLGELAEAEHHHPDIAFGWGYATVSLRTKKICGLHENDFIMAAKIDGLAGARQVVGGECAAR